MLQNIGYQFVFRKIPDVIAGAGIPEVGLGKYFLSVSYSGRLSSATRNSERVRELRIDPKKLV